MIATNYLTMDPNILYSIVNTKLRNDFDDLEDLAKSLELERRMLEQRLAGAGFHYDPARNQFRQTRSDAHG